MQKAGFKPAFLLQYEVCLAFIVRWSGAVQGFCQLEIWCKQKPSAPPGAGSASVMIRAGTSSRERDIADDLAQTQKR
jgi:hypothetical protein